MKNLLILLLILTFAACSHETINPSTDETVLYYCDANFIPSDWNADACTATDHSTCCVIPYRDEHVETCFSYSDCAWSFTQVLTPPRECTN